MESVYNVSDNGFNQIVTMENEIALMRQGYNDSVERHNTRIQRLPEVGSNGRIFQFRQCGQRPVVPRFVGQQVVEHRRPGLVRIAFVGELDLFACLVKQLQQRCDCLFVAALFQGRLEETFGLRHGDGRRLRALRAAPTGISPSWGNRITLFHYILHSIV